MPLFQRSSNARLSSKLTISALAQVSQRSLDMSMVSVDENDKENAMTISGNNRSSLLVSAAQQQQLLQEKQLIQQRKQQLHQYELLRKRLYRVGLNLFNSDKPERGVQHLTDYGFIEPCTKSNLAAQEPEEERLARGVANFLISKRGLSKQMIGAYLGNLQCNFNQLVVSKFIEQIDFTNLQVDIALRKYQTYFRFPGEAQKIERLVEVFSEQYYKCNYTADGVPNNQLHQPHLSKDEIFILSFAIIMLNTDLHIPSNKKRMTLAQWLKNLSGVFKAAETSTYNESFLVSIYNRIKDNELQTGDDHCNQVLRVQQQLAQYKQDRPVPNLTASQSRRLVCFCRLNEVRTDESKLTKPEKHQREIFLFNDLLLICKLRKKRSSAAIHPNESGDTSSGNPLTLKKQYNYCKSIPLVKCTVELFSSKLHRYALKVISGKDQQVLITLNAQNQVDQLKLYDDLCESIEENDHTERMRTVSGEKCKQSDCSAATANTATSDDIKETEIDLSNIKSSLSQSTISTLSSSCSSSSSNVSISSTHYNSFELDDQHTDMNLSLSSLIESINDNYESINRELLQSHLSTINVIDSYSKLLHRCTPENCSITLV